MNIEGLETTLNYVIHNPIRVVVTLDNDNSQYMEVSFSDSDTEYKTRYYPIGNIYFVEIQQWLQLFFSDYECDFDYNVDGTGFKNVLNHNRKQLVLTFTIYYLSSDETSAITSTFINGYNQRINNNSNWINNTQKLSRVFWRNYPFSLIMDASYSTLRVTDGKTDFIDDDVQIRNFNGCNGVYVRWLSYDSNYNYWLFPVIEEKETTKEIGVKDRWFLKEEEQTANEDTLGLTSVKEFTLSDTVNRQYWDLINTIFRSPEIYIMKRLPTDDFPFTLQDWDKVRIKGQSYSNKSMEEAQRYSIDFYYDKQYSQVL
jgi:hypothetical protein